MTDQDGTRLNDLMAREMASQPTMLGDALPDLRRQAAAIPTPRFDRVMLTGSGDSGYAAAALEHAFQVRTGLPTWALSSAAASRYGENRLSGLFVAVSVSGSVVRTLEAAEAARRQGAFVVAITANGESRLAQLADAALVMPHPITRATPHTRDYTATLLALAVLLERVTGQPIPELDRWSDDTAEILVRAAPWAEAIGPRAMDRQLIFLGMGPDRGTAMYGALKLWEGGGMRGLWDDLEEFGHGSQLLARPGDGVVVFATGRGRSRAAEMLPGLRTMGLRPITIAVGGALISPNDFAVPAYNPDLLPLVTCLPVQALAFAAAEAEGIDVAIPLAGRPEGQTYDDVHMEWMRESALELQPEPTAPTRA